MLASDSYTNETLDRIEKRREAVGSAMFASGSNVDEAEIALLKESDEVSRLPMEKGGPYFWTHDSQFVVY